MVRMLKWLAEFLWTAVLFFAVLVLGGYLALGQFVRGLGRFAAAGVTLALTPFFALGFSLHALYWVCRGRSVSSILETLREAETEWKEKRKRDEAMGALLRAATLLGIRLSGDFPEGPDDLDDDEEEDDYGGDDERVPTPPRRRKGRRDLPSVPVDDSRIVKFRGKKRPSTRSPAMDQEPASERGSRPRD
jgi:hypothetical protein